MKLAVIISYHKMCRISSVCLTRNSSEDETANVNFFYDDIVHVLQNAKITL